MARGRPRLPQAKAIASGAVMQNAGRFKDRKTPKRTRPLGAPYKSMTAQQRAAWKECVEEMPWLHSGHRQILRVACVLIARVANEPDVPVGALTALHVALSKLGATPTDETKVNHGDSEEDDPTDEFFRGKPN